MGHNRYLSDITGLAYSTVRYPFDAETLTKSGISADRYLRDCLSH